MSLRTTFFLTSSSGRASVLSPVAVKLASEFFNKGGDCGLSINSVDTPLMQGLAPKLAHFLIEMMSQSAILTSKKEITNRIFEDSQAFRLLDKNKYRKN